MLILTTRLRARARESVMLSSLPHAPPLSASLPRLFSTRAAMASTSARIAVVGDVHDLWNLEEDNKALQFLQPDLVLFTGDFGEENIELVRSVAKLEFTKAIILGNHDAWHTKTFSGKEKDGVQLQLECLGEEHVAYRRLDYPTLKLSIVGGRPFTHGGNQLFRIKLLSARYGIQDMTGSAKRICKAALGAPADHMVIILAHNGPTGLGSSVDDICGKDWDIGGGDYGDADLAQALSLLKESGKIYVPLVVFGHMHKQLAYGKGLRKMIVVGADNTIYLNAAIVPRVKRLSESSNENIVNNEPGLPTPERCGTIRAFTLVEILNGRFDKIVETWVSVDGDRTKLEEEHILFRNDS